MGKVIFADRVIAGCICFVQPPRPLQVAALLTLIFAPALQTTSKLVVVSSVSANGRNILWLHRADQLH
jgi:hypothetical protein